MQWWLMQYVWIAVWPITHILFIDEAIQPEMSLIAEDDFSIKIRIIFKLLLSPIHKDTILVANLIIEFVLNFTSRVF